jgi:hypothetical protein
MLEKRFVRAIRPPSYAIPLIVLIRNEPCDIADRLAIIFSLCLKLSLQITGASGKLRVRGDIRVLLRDQFRESLLNTSSCRPLTRRWSVLSLCGTHAEQSGDGRRGYPCHYRRPYVLSLLCGTGRCFCTRTTVGYAIGFLSYDGKPVPLRAFEEREAPYC